jgi:ATP-dependent exoDNAse (exonuclease V) alpha subunit
VAIYHLSAKIVSRSTGRSSVAAAAYRSGSRLHDERTGQDHDYTRKGGVEHSEIVAPKNAPNWMLDRATLWNTVERVEKRRDAQLAREIEVALPRELAAESRAGLVRGFVQTEFVDRGMIADFAVHDGRARDGGEQPHAHIMLTTRELMGEGFGPKNRDWNGTDKLEGWRARWAEHVNAELERGGCDARVDHRTLAVQQAEAERQARQARDVGHNHAAEREEERAAALDREPEPKLGPTASQMEKLGHFSRRGDERREVESRNAERRTLQEQMRELAKQIAEAARQVAEDARRRLENLAQRLDAAYTAVRERAEAVVRPMPALMPLEQVAADPGRGGATQEVAATLRDALLGRHRPMNVDRATTIDRDRLLGRQTDGEARSAPARDDDRSR